MADRAEIHSLGDFLVFYIGATLYGVSSEEISEIQRQFHLTPVPLAPYYVKGLLNLRGTIVTVIDLASRLGLGETSASQENRVLIVSCGKELIGLLLEKIDDVVKIDLTTREKIPANMDKIQRPFFLGVAKSGSRLIGILNLQEILKT
jgi:purine-binding chemotaxis protein CheW